MTDEKLQEEPTDDLRPEAVEAGVGELLSVYEGLEERYFAAATAAPPAYEPRTSYATHT